MISAYFGFVLLSIIYGVASGLYIDLYPGDMRVRKIDCLLF
jgi:hypothetical protein